MKGVSPSSEIWASDAQHALGEGAKHILGIGRFLKDRIGATQPFTRGSIDARVDHEIAPALRASQPNHVHPPFSCR